jgi:hypothetical protein
MIALCGKAEIDVASILRNGFVLPTLHPSRNADYG